MPPFPKPSFAYTYHLGSQLLALREYRDTKPGRTIPPKDPNRLLVASWNVANLGVQERRPQDYRLIAEIISWFDLVAVQEVNDNLDGLRGILGQLAAMPGGDRYRALFSDEAGNNERLTYLYDAAKVTLREKVGEIAIPPSEQRFVHVDADSPEFRGFDRNPYLAAFGCGDFEFVIVNVHLYFGSDAAPGDIARRRNETYAVARWADMRHESDYAYSRNVIVLGDFNMPQADWGDPIYCHPRVAGPLHPAALQRSRGKQPRRGQALRPDRLFPRPYRGTEHRGRGVRLRRCLVRPPVGDTTERLRRYLRYYISDHRPSGRNSRWHDRAARPAGTWVVSGLTHRRGSHRQPYRVPELDTGQPGTGWRHHPVDQPVD